MSKLPCFKAYDVRGRVPTELDDRLAHGIGRAYATYLNPRRVALGRDMRLSSAGLADALAEGLMETGVEVVDLGLCGTEQVYFYTEALKLDGGIMVTASHNPPDFNGMKFVREGSRPISGDSGLRDIEALALDHRQQAAAATKGIRLAQDSLGGYVEHLLSYVDLRALRPLTVVTNPGNGCWCCNRGKAPWECSGLGGKGEGSPAVSHRRPSTAG
jgi:phosphomannomutase